MTPSQLEEAVTRAAEALRSHGAREVYLFGSAERGSAGPDSDLDLAVTGLPPGVFFRAIAMAHRAAGRVVDVVDLDHDSAFTRHLRGSGNMRRVA